MPLVTIANPKGGTGKSTLATNLAGCFAHRGHGTMLGDMDRQHSAREWLERRPAHLPRIETWERSEKKTLRPPKGVTHVVLDTPAGLKGDRLEEVLGVSSRVLVPLQPSAFDLSATKAFLARLAEVKAVRKGRTEVAVVGMRVDLRTRSADELRHFLEDLDLPVLGFLRDTQLYVQLAGEGLTLWDLPPSRAERDLLQWLPLVRWAEA
ncbi:MAG: ParA family protein [Acidobacteria bacterium]|nr:ParA family protein [Acidobacteriota bacterium]